MPQKELNCWHGWVPILTSELLTKHAIEALRGSEEPLMVLSDKMRLNCIEEELRNGLLPKDLKLYFEGNDYSCSEGQITSKGGDWEIIPDKSKQDKFVLVPSDKEVKLYKKGLRIVNGKDYSQGRDTRYNKELKQNISFCSNRIEDKLKISSNEEVLCWIRVFSDLKVSLGKKLEKKLIAVSVDKTSACLSKIGIYTWRQGNEVIACVKSVESKGLVSFFFESSITKVAEEIYADEVFGIIRDIYHDHVYISSSDRLLKPIRGSRKQGIEGVLQQYQNKNVDYHTEIKGLIDDYENKTTPTRSLTGLRPELFQRISAARGEMVYAMSFSTLYGKCTESFRFADSSFKNLEKIATRFLNSWELGRKNRGGKRILFLTMALVFLAGFQVFSSLGVETNEALRQALIVVLVILLIMVLICR